MDEPAPRPTSETRAVTAEVVRDGGDWSAAEPAEDTVRAVVTALNDELGLRDGAVVEVVVALADDDHVRRLNREFRGQDKATNVLSFEADGSALPEDAPALLGDIVLAAETVVREAAALEVAPRDHVAHLVAHGILHLLGHDHDTPETTARMEALESRILARMGLADPYDEERYALATEEERPGGRSPQTP